VLVVMTGLPGAGKTTLARAVGAALPAPVLSVDSIERAIRRAGVGGDQPVGLAAYAVAQALAGEELAAGHAVVADAVNVAPEARAAWEDLAATHGAPLVVIAVRCRDRAVHRARVESRAATEAGMPAMTWERAQQLAAQQRPWPGELALDSCDDIDGNLRQALARIEERR
jgi:predicted kinase